MVIMDLFVMIAAYVIIHAESYHVSKKLNQALYKAQKHRARLGLT